MIFRTIKSEYKKIFKIPVGPRSNTVKPLGTLTLGQMTVPFDKNFWFPSPVYGEEHEDRINKIIERINE